MVVVRVPGEDEVSLTTALDAGASGIIIPHCETREQVEEFMKRIYYRTYNSAETNTLVAPYSSNNVDSSPHRRPLLQPLGLYPRHLGRFSVPE